MVDAVIHIAAETHEEFKAECKNRGMKMTDVVSRLIKEWLNPSGEIKKKKLPLEPTNKDPTNPYARPPFWAGRKDK